MEQIDHRLLVMLDTIRGSQPSAAAEDVTGADTLMGYLQRAQALQNSAIDRIGELERLLC